jgi:hypothetical protein
MNLKRVAAIAAGMLAVIAGLHFWLNSEPSSPGGDRRAGAGRTFTVAYIPVT